MKRTYNEIFSLLPICTAIIVDGEWYGVRGHTEDDIWVYDEDGNESHIPIAGLVGRNMDMYQQVLIEERGSAE